jgi:hypothetical protein
MAENRSAASDTFPVMVRSMAKIPQLKRHDVAAGGREPALAGRAKHALAAECNGSVLDGLYQR